MQASSSSKHFVLLTGVAGFIGSNVAIYLTQKYGSEYTFIGLDKMSYCSRLGNLDPIRDDPNFIFVKADLTKMEDLQKIFKDYPIEEIIHFAAYTHVDHSFANSILFTHNNVLGTHNLLEVATHHHVKKFIHVSTDEVYGNSETLSTEDSLLAPTNPYAATKAAAEHLVMSYAISFQLPVIITRGNNVYGPRQYPEKVIPKFIRHLRAGESCPIQGNGHQKRSFLYVDDVARAFEVIWQRGQIGNIYNIGSKHKYSVQEVATRLIKLFYPTEDPQRWISYVEDRKFNDQRYYISHEKLEALGWKKETSFQEGLQKTLEWYQTHPEYLEL
jgi:dTDP-glucose 4,6-dehydratase